MSSTYSENTKTKSPGMKKKYSNPFPGLRPFTIEESHLFFGREGQSEEVIRHLAANRFVALIGASGSGKSSLMYCGVVPVLHGGFITGSGLNWRIFQMRPGNDPLGNMAEALIEENIEMTGEEREMESSILNALIRRSSNGLVDAVKQVLKPGDENILFIIDQFEELFRYKKSRKGEEGLNESEAFVKLIVNTVRQTELPVYVVLTMRSDFIGDCSQFQELTSLINDSNYLIPQMTREDFKKAIEGPVAVGNASIDPFLVQQLLNEVGDNPDQLPILQHALMRTWDYWVEREEFDQPIGLADYEAVGKMESALSMHANEAYDELDEEEKRICESMFKTLTEKGHDNRGIRHPARLSAIAEIARADISGVAKVVEVFRMPGRSFIVPSYEISLDSDSIIDISHESLMRIWNRLRMWVEEEANAVLMYLRLSEAAELYQMGRTGLWRPPDLQLATNWREKQKPTLTWAARYNPAFERAMVYLETSEQEFSREEENKVRQQKRQLRRTRIFAIVLGSAAIISIGLFIYTRDLQLAADRARVEAEHRTTEAQEQREIAEQQRQRAEDALLEAEQQRSLAQQQTEISEEQRRLAEQNAQRALIQEQQARKNLELANEQRQLALNNAEEARRQSQLADEKSREAFNRRMLSISLSLAVKSQQVENDPRLKGLLAYQGFLFNEGFEGPSHNPDIYLGLYSSVKALKGDDYNVLKGHDDAIKSITFQPETNTIFSTGSDGKIIKWNLYNNPVNYNVISSNQLSNEVLVVSPDGKYLVCGTDGMGIQIFETARENLPPRYLNAHNGKIRSLAFASNSRTLFSSGTGGDIRRWNVLDGSSEEIINHNARIIQIALSPDDKYLAIGTRNGEVIIYDTKNEYKSRVISQIPRTSVFTVAFNPDGKYLAAGDMEGNIRIWNTNQWKLTGNINAHNARVQDVKFSPGADILGSVSLDGTIKLWDLNDLNNPPVVLSDHEGFVFALAFSPDGQGFVTGSTEEDRLIYRPTEARYMAIDFCSLLNRNFTREEWSTFVGEDVQYQATCSEKELSLDSAIGKVKDTTNDKF